MYTYINTYKHIYTYISIIPGAGLFPCNTLQHTASHCITLHHTATHCITPQHTASRCITLHHILQKPGAGLRISTPLLATRSATGKEGHSAPRDTQYVCIVPLPLIGISPRELMRSDCVCVCNRTLKLVALLRKMTCNLRHPMSLRHPVVPLFLIAISPRDKMRSRIDSIIGLFCKRDL